MRKERCKFCKKEILFPRTVFRKGYSIGIDGIAFYQYFGVLDRGEAGHLECIIKFLIKKNILTLKN